MQWSVTLTAHACVSHVSCVCAFEQGHCRAVECLSLVRATVCCVCVASAPTSATHTLLPFHTTTQACLQPTHALLCPLLCDTLEFDASLDRQASLSSPCWSTRCSSGDCCHSLPQPMSPTTSRYNCVCGCMWVLAGESMRECRTYQRARERVCVVVQWTLACMCVTMLASFHHLCTPTEAAVQ